MIDLENASVLEIAWSVLAFVGLIITLSNVGEGMRDLILGLKQRDDALVPVVAWNNLRNEVVLATALAGFLLLGLIAMSTPEDPAPVADVGNVVRAAILIGLELLIVINSFVNRRDRQILKEPLGSQ